MDMCVRVRGVSAKGLDFPRDTDIETDRQKHREVWVCRKAGKYQFFLLK